MLDAGIGGDATAFLMDSQAMPVALFELKGAKPDAKQRFMEIVEGEAARLAADGIPRDLLEASLAQLSFELRERDRGMADGVVLAMNALSGWLYDDALATTYLRYEDALAHMREGLGGRYFRRRAGVAHREVEPQGVARSEARRGRGTTARKSANSPRSLRVSMGGQASHSR